MASDVLATLAGLTWPVSVALALLLALRVPLRRLFGTAFAYQVWLVVPALIIAAFLPAPVRRYVVLPALPRLPTVAAPALDAGASDWPLALLLAWLAGVLALAVWFGRSHRNYLRSLGKLSARDGLFYSESVTAGPALLGLWRPMVVVPCDFLARYTLAEQALIIRHERVHARRGDALANLLQACLQCVFWFNPLIHVAARFFRTDQELACDAAVIRSCPGERRAYAQALLKSQMVSSAAPATVACHWQSTHPVKERIMRLQQALPNKTRRIAGRFALASLILSSMGGALAAREPAVGARTYDVAMRLETAGETVSPRVLVRDGERFAVSSVHGGVKWTFQFTVTGAQSANTVQLRGKIDADETTVSSPTLLGHLGEPMRVRIASEGGKSFDLALVVTELKRPES